MEMNPKHNWNANSNDIFFIHQLRGGWGSGSSAGRDAFVLFSNREPFKRFPLCLLCFTSSPRDVTLPASDAQSVLGASTPAATATPPLPPPLFFFLVPSASLILDTSDYPTLSFTKDHGYKRQREEGICLWAKYLQADFHFQRLTPLNK